jgi:uncharacterized protein YegJ (DUF2314 family)
VRCAGAERRAAGAAVLLLLATAARAGEAPPAAGTPLPLGPLRGLAIAELALLVPAADTARAEELVRRLAPIHLPGHAFATWSKGGTMPPPPGFVSSVREPAPLEPQYLKVAARGLDEAAQARLTRGLPSVFLSVATPPAQAQRALRGLVAVAAEAARQLRALVSDPEARVVWGPDAFLREVAEGGFEGEVPFVAAHINIHSYAAEGAGGLLRSVTLGMSKLGLPDLVVNGHPRGEWPTVVELLRASCQALADDPRIVEAGALKLDLERLDSKRAREAARRIQRPGAKGRARVTLAVAPREQGDAENGLVELTFGGFTGSPTERQHALLVALFGYEDRIFRVRGDEPELLAARDRARAELLALRAPFRKGLPAGTQLQVKAPFEEKGRREYMWIEVLAWEGRRIRGILTGVPEIATALRPGAVVEVDEADAYDYLVRQPDGTEVGNHTGAAILRLQQAAAPAR